MLRLSEHGLIAEGLCGSLQFNVLLISINNGWVVLHCHLTHCCLQGSLWSGMNSTPPTSSVLTVMKQSWIPGPALPLCSWATLGELHSLSEPQILHLDGAAALRMALGFSLCIASAHGTNICDSSTLQANTSSPIGIPLMIWVWSQPDLSPNPG